MERAFARGDRRLIGGVAIRTPGSAASMLARISRGMSAITSAGSDADQFADRVFEGALARVGRAAHPAGRDVRIGQAEGLAVYRERRQDNCLALAPGMLFVHGARGDDAHHVAPGELVGNRRLQLLGQGDDALLRDQLRQIAVEGMMRNAGHRDALPVSGLFSR